jgi:hypothetical protein
MNYSIAIFCPHYNCCLSTTTHKTCLPKQVD